MKGRAVENGVGPSCRKRVVISAWQAEEHSIPGLASALRQTRVPFPQNMLLKSSCRPPNEHPCAPNANRLRALLGDRGGRNRPPTMATPWFCALTPPPSHTMLIAPQPTRMEEAEPGC